MARWLLTLLQDAHGLLLHSTPTPAAAAAPAADAAVTATTPAASTGGAHKEELVNITCEFVLPTHQQPTIEVACSPLPPPLAFVFSTTG